MTKQELLKAFNGVIESQKLWVELSKIVYQLGGEIFETKYIESLSLHQELVWDLILDFRGFDEFSQAEYEEFQDAIYELANGNSFQFYDAEGIRHTLIDRKKILDLFLKPHIVESMLSES